MSMRAVRVDTAGEGMIILRLDRPPGNVLGIDLCRQLCQEIATAADDEAAKLLVVASAGEHFSFGASVEEHLPEQAEEMLAAMSELVNVLYSHPYPTLAAIRGRCLGGGLEVALACDMLVAERSSIMAAPEIRLGVFAPAATVLLQAGVPRCVAAEVLLAGRDLSAAEALQFGMVNRVVADGTLDEAVVEFAGAFAGHSAASLRQATRALRRACATRTPTRLREELRRAERQYLDELLALPDGTEGIRAFLDKREPVWERG